MADDLHLALNELNTAPAKEVPLDLASETIPKDSTQRHERAAVSGAAGADSAGGPTADKPLTMINNKKEQAAVFDENEKEFLRMAKALTACDLNHLAKAGDLGQNALRLFSKFLFKTHGINIGRVDEEVESATSVRAWVTLGVREGAEKRRCRYDGKDWTFAETLQWVYNERDGCYDWALGMWLRDFSQR